MRGGHDAVFVEFGYGGQTGAAGGAPRGLGVTPSSTTIADAKTEHLEELTKRTRCYPKCWFREHLVRPF